MEITKKNPPKINTAFLNFLVIVLGFGSFQMGYAISGNNQTANIMAVKFKWTEEET